MRKYGINILPPNHILESNQCPAAKVSVITKLLLLNQNHLKVKDYGGKHYVQRSFGAKSDLDDEKKLSVKEHIKR